MEESEEDRLANAAFLISHGKQEAGLDLLEPLLKEKNVIAVLLVVECEISCDKCTSAAERLLSSETYAQGDIDVRSGFAFLQARLVLECKREDLRQSAITRLQDVLSVKPNPALAELLESLQGTQNSSKAQK